MANAEQAKEWNTTEGEHWVAHQARYDRILGGYGERLLDAADIGEADVVLDIGCGCGDTTRNVARRAMAGSALGVDLSGPMLDRARTLAVEQGLDNASFERVDAQVHDFKCQQFTRAISRFGVMFFADPVAAFTNIGGALQPGSRVAFTCWRDVTENEYLMVPAAAALEFVELPDWGDESQPGPFSLAAKDRIRSVLHDAGLTKVVVEPLDLPLHLGTDVPDTVAFILYTGLAKELLGSADDDSVDKATAAITDVLKTFETPDGVVLGSGAWLVTATRP